MSDNINEGKLLATSGTTEGITKLISQYYFGSTITLNPIDDNTFEVSNKKGKIDGVQVIKKGNKFRFEQI